jgi:hypothetical protein
MATILRTVRCPVLLATIGERPCPQWPPQSDNVCLQGLDRETLGILMALCEQGVNPEALAEVVKYLRKDGDRR